MGKQMHKNTKIIHILPSSHNYLKPTQIPLFYRLSRHFRAVRADRPSDSVGFQGVLRDALCLLGFGGFSFFVWGNRRGLSWGGWGFFGCHVDVDGWEVIDCGEHAVDEVCGVSHFLACFLH